LALRRIHVPVAKYYPEEQLIEIEADLAIIHWAYAKLLLQRYARLPRTDFKEGGWRDEVSTREGVVGQRIFQSLLNEWRVPYIHDDPVFEFKEHRTFHDFVVPSFGSIEIKTFGKNDRHFVVKRELWQWEKEMNGVPDYVIALRLTGKNVAKVEGWLHGSEVENLPNNPRVCRYVPCHCCRFEELRDFNEIGAKLKAYSMKI